jgi:hypothetical protein
MYILASKKLTVGKRGGLKTFNATFATKANINITSWQKGKNKNPRNKKNLGKKLKKTSGGEKKAKR